MKKVEIPASVAKLANVEMKASSKIDEKKLQDAFTAYYSDSIKRKIKLASKDIKELVTILEQFSDVTDYKYSQGAGRIILRITGKLYDGVEENEEEPLNSAKSIDRAIQEYCEFNTIGYKPKPSSKVYDLYTCYTKVVEYNKKKHTYVAEVWIQIP